jgi:pseudouridine-5'-phosphate glycosidase
VEQVARDNGAIPATIAILDGRIHVGLTRGQLETLAKLGHACRKCSR